MEQPMEDTELKKNNEIRPRTKESFEPVYENPLADDVPEETTVIEPPLPLEVIPIVPDEKSITPVLSPQCSDAEEENVNSKSCASASSHISNRSGSYTEYNTEDEVRKNLRNAIEMNNVEATASAMEEFRSFNLVDIDGDLIRGERVIGLHDCMQGLNYAITKRDVKTLERAIFVTKQRNFQEELANELQTCETMLKELKKLERLMTKLSRAIKANDTKLIQNLTFQIRAMSGFDQATVDKMLELHEIKEDLKTAVSSRNLELTLKTLDRIKEKGYENDMASEIKQAEKMIKEIEYLEKVRKDILNLSQSKIGEIRSYASPPRGVHGVMRAVYYVLGYSISQVENWTDIRALMGRTDKERLKAQILNIDPRKVQLHQVQEAKAEIEQFDVKAISEISLALGLFYVFVSSVIEEVEKLHAGVLSAPSPFFFELASPTPAEKIGFP